MLKIFDGRKKGFCKAFVVGLGGISILVPGILCRKYHYNTIYHGIYK